MLTGLVRALALLRADGVDPEAFLPFAAEAMAVMALDFGRLVEQLAATRWSR